MASAAYGKGKGKDMRKVQCFSCMEYGHIAANCAKKSCNYCKKQGHFIKECPTRPQNRQVTLPACTPEMFEQIKPVLSALRLLGPDVGREDTREGA
ncbi:hypothetical protein LWI29_012478 [Acer saccharum]|uniref:CCHC-type domain-containing protein n=1 Tax=Acer saccharum TaxID=4024 RepID=A0AA39SMS5_ACESA|nr:hypothetical protein LWI29_012478 [Acer saccharum]